MNGCTSPKAVNFNPSADVDDRSCLFLKKVDGICYAFQDVAADDVIDHSYTLSYSLLGKDWVFFHDYYPDFYFSTKTQLYNIKDSKIYIHHKGPYGVYHNDTPKSFFIDAVFAAQEEMILNSINWISEVFNNSGEVEFTTLTHITVWNNQQCTGRIALSQVFSALQYQVRKTQGLWNFDDFRDMVKTYGSPFLLDLFNNFAVDSNNIDVNKPWFNKDLLHDNFFIIRFEFDNTQNKQLIFHGGGIDASKSYR